MQYNLATYNKISGIYYSFFSDNYYLLDFNNISNSKFFKKPNNPLTADPKLLIKYP